MLNLKKFIMLFFVSAITVLSVMADHDERFFNALSNCTPYISNGSIEVSNVIADYKSQILGWENDRCVYRETVKFADIDSCVICRFSSSQIADIIGVMKNYKVAQSSSGEEVDIMNIKELKNTPVAKVWNRYLHDPTVCQLEINK